MSCLGTFAGYEAHLLVQGFPGKSLENGGLGWSSIVLLLGHGRTVLVDTGSFSVRKILLDRLGKLGIARTDVTDILLTHAHYDHMMNWPMFPNARVAISDAELTHALSDPIETSLSAELYVEALAASPRLRRLRPGEAPLEGLSAFEAPGHSPHHLVFMVEDGDGRLILAADAVKNRAEFLSADAASSEDGAASARSIRRIAEIFAEREGTILVAGHDLPMRNEGGRPVRFGTRRAAITGWFGDSLATPTRFQLDSSDTEGTR